MKRIIWALTAAAVGALAFAVTGCGDSGSSDPTKVAVNVTENGKGDYTVAVPKEIEQKETVYALVMMKWLESDIVQPQNGSDGNDEPGDVSPKPGFISACRLVGCGRVPRCRRCLVDSGASIQSSKRYQFY